MHHANRLCEDTLRAIFLPRAREEVCRYYRDFLTVKPQLMCWCMKLVNLRHSPGECSRYLIDFELYPYIGQKVTIAVCRLTFSVKDYDGEIKLESFRQVRSFPVPEHLWDVVCQPF
ncbi:DUF3888 domain-containing protein [Clostridiaceae bacterium NSJ-31]|uniref:DUF3888 domain-containing protein n=1 Tax=Ligaoa zhengdingensis TaxID=2763658 RepID=A0A926E1I6_9FIRM|nr:DUF3888 domain-containing protein [Ligaoa zhengdingensis]MBC8547432.1 DUF3888 domain-containing protein [Ligaoa zhengdingensis]